MFQNLLKGTENLG